MRLITEEELPEWALRPEEGIHRLKQSPLESSSTFELFFDAGFRTLAFKQAVVWVLEDLELRDAKVFFSIDADHVWPYDRIEGLFERCVGTDELARPLARNVFESDISSSQLLQSVMVSLWQSWDCSLVDVESRFEIHFSHDEYFFARSSATSGVKAFENRMLAIHAVKLRKKRWGLWFRR